MSKLIYQPTWESLNQHKLPKWFMDAKLGIFIHWGVYSVPAWAPPYTDKKQYYDEDIGYHPYAELYGWGMMYKDSPVWKYHVDKYGADFQYEDFFPMFKAEKWNPVEWSKLFKDIGAKYVVLVTKHSDGYCMWPTKYSKRNCFETGPKRDITGELTEAVKAQGLKMGLYYSTTFNYYYDRSGHITYRNLTHNQVKEIIDKYDPAILWSDDYWKPEEKSYEAAWKSKELISYFYNHAENPDEVVTNDRWGVEENGLQLGDFSTPEYRVLPDITDFYWELTRGIGQSYGYSQLETDKDYISVNNLIKMFVDVVSKNGNMLLNVGPKADGTLEPLQVDRLKGLGEFLNTNGEAIYGTRHWVAAEGESADGIDIRYTTKDNAVYAILMGNHKSKLTIKDLRLQPDSKIKILGYDAEELKWAQDENGLHVYFPEKLPNSYARTLKITPEPYRLMQKKPIKYEDKYGEIFRRSGFIKLNL